MTTPASRPAPGTRLQFEWRKWDGAPHWVHDCVYLGVDGFGDWFGQRRGWRSARPGRAFDAGNDHVTLMPVTGDFAATAHRGHPRLDVYIDLAWDVRWDDGEPRGIDMDLDVVQAHDGRGLFLDDRDEWDDHRVRYGYPADVQAHVERLARELLGRVAASDPPFDAATAQGWLDRLDAWGRPGPA